LDGAKKQAYLVSVSVKRFKKRDGILTENDPIWIGTIDTESGKHIVGEGSNELGLGEAWCDSRLKG